MKCEVIGIKDNHIKWGLDYQFAVKEIHDHEGYISLTGFTAYQTDLQNLLNLDNIYELRITDKDTYTKHVIKDYKLMELHTESKNFGGTNYTLYWLELLAYKKGVDE